MEREFTAVYESLDSIKTNLQNLNSDNRKKPVAQVQIEDAKKVYAKLNTAITQFNELTNTSRISEEEILLVKELADKSQSIYRDITEFSKSLQSIYPSMSAVDLKTAISLLPVLKDTESSTNQLIDAIELYESVLTDDGKRLLINFVLKTRLSSSAKLRVLKLINEKMVWKRFADGLRNQRLSSIIASRNFVLLKDAIRAAQYEEINSNYITPEVMNMTLRGRATAAIRGNNAGRGYARVSRNNITRGSRRTDRHRPIFIRNKRNAV
ncbi:hypothetical protein HUJ04_011261 [Dendroctonus ponderosae]|nr:hypothetical protein HUJ04_011261 [Dendroctonus ponderosae]